MFKKEIRAQNYDFASCNMFSSSLKHGFVTSNTFCFPFCLLIHFYFCHHLQMIYLAGFNNHFNNVFLFKKNSYNEIIKYIPSSHFWATLQIFHCVLDKTGKSNDKSRFSFIWDFLNVLLWLHCVVKKHLRNRHMRLWMTRNTGLNPASSPHFFVVLQS